MSYARFFRREGFSLIAIAFVASAATSMCSAPAVAHDQWADGSPIPAWVSKSCCGVADAHRLTVKQIYRVEGGWRAEGYAHMIPRTAFSHPRTETCGSFLRVTRTATNQLRFASLFRKGARKNPTPSNARSLSASYFGNGGNLGSGTNAARDWSNLMEGGACLPFRSHRGVALLNPESDR
jgi:hypothetical protein